MTDALELIKQINEHPLWECYVLPSVVAMLAKLTCQDENPLALFDRGEFLFSELLELIADGRLSLLRTPPVARCPGPAAAWLAWQTALLRMDARALLAESIELAAEQYSDSAPAHVLPEMIQKEIVHDLTGMQMQPAIMDEYRRFVVIRHKTGDKFLSEDRDGVSFDWLSDVGCGGKIAHS